MSLTGEDARVRALRGPKEVPDPRRPIASLVEFELTSDGSMAETLTVFLAGAECPFTCVFCDLWRQTLDGKTPSGSLPRQIEAALEEVPASENPRRLKLYNASNFFDRRAVPQTDLEAIAQLAAGFDRVVVECHPRLVDDRCLQFAERLREVGDCRLEVAMGLETVHPESLPALNKKMTLDDWNRATETLSQADIAHRAFVLIGAPFVEPSAMVDWTVITVAYALDRGAETVSLISVRGGNGELDRLAEAGHFREPRLSEIETAFERAQGLDGGVVLLDTWDLERFSSQGTCNVCRPRRLERLNRMNQKGTAEPLLADCDCVAPQGRRQR